MMFAGGMQGISLIVDVCVCLLLNGSVSQSRPWGAKDGFD